MRAGILAIANRGDDAVGQLASHTVYVEESPEALLAICEVISLLSCWIAIIMGFPWQQVSCHV
jgi:hypothetical protein